MEPVAIIGFSFKLPQDVHDEESFWSVLQQKRNLMTEWPKNRVNIDAFYDPSGTMTNALYSRGGHFIDQDPAEFDAPFFSITAKEAAAMDPQHRMSLETTFCAFENAGIPLETIRGSRTAVFAASMSDDYARMHAKDPDSAPRMVIVGTPPSLLANRISYHFNITGPSVHIDTACSSSTIAVDLACQSLHSGDSNLAVVTAANLILGPEDSVLMSSLNFLSKDSVCYSFDDRATGYGRGEGVISLILKPLTAAVQDGDMIRAVIRSTGSNQDGRTPVLPQPNAKSQEELIRHVYRKAGLDLELTHYVEAHGTGTSVGDPIEAKAIGNAFKSARSLTSPLFIGSLKANIGHLEAASGLAAIIKAVMILEKGVIPPNALFEKVNSTINLGEYNIKIPTECTQWPTEGPRRVSVSSFGFGGSNCHVILDDAFHYLQSHGLNGNHCTTISAGVLPQEITQCTTLINHMDAEGFNPLPSEEILRDHASSPQRQSRDKVPTHPQILIWSASDEGSLKRQLKAYETYYKNRIQGSQLLLDRLAITLANRRTRMAWRAFAIALPISRETDEVLSFSKPVRCSTAPKLAFVFTGQGAQYANMGMELLRYPVFQTALQRIDAEIRRLGSNWSILDKIQNNSNIDHPEYSQVLCTALQIGVVELLRSFSVRPSVIIGHSSGEIAAAYTLGALSVESASKVAFYRGQLAARLKNISSSSMLAVNLPEERLGSYLQSFKQQFPINQICLACVNSPSNITLSGPEKFLDIIQEQLDKDVIFAQKLRTGVAYHSPIMQEIANDYESALGTLFTGEAVDASAVMISSISAEVVSASQVATARYWVENLTSTVRFRDAVASIAQPVRKENSRLELTVTDFLEIGPHSTLRRSILDTVREVYSPKGELSIRYLPALLRNRSPVITIFEALGQLFCFGYPLTIGSHNITKSRVSTKNKPLPLLVDCPQYLFDHSRRYWEESRLSRDYRFRVSKPSELLGRPFHDWNPLQPRWRNISSLNSIPWLGDHEISGTKIYPATAMLLMGIEAVNQIIPSSRQISGYYIKQAKFLNPIIVHDEAEGKTETMLHLRPIQQPYDKEATWFEIQVFAYINERWSECFYAKLQVQSFEAVDDVDSGRENKMSKRHVFENYQHASKSCIHPVSREDFYKFCRAHGHNYGTSFQLLEDIRWDGGDVTVGRIDTSSPLHHNPGNIHPTVLDAALHIFLVQSSNGLSHSSPTFVPRELTNAWIASSGWQRQLTSSILLSMTTKYKPGGSVLEGAAYAINEEGAPLWILPKVELFALSNNVGGQGSRKRNRLYKIDWKPQMSLLKPVQLRQLCGLDCFDRDEIAMSHYFEKLTFTLHMTLRKTMSELTEEDRSNTPPHLLRYLAWMDHVVKQQLQNTPEEGIISKIIDDTEMEELIQEVEVLFPPWKMFPAIARNLKPILCGQVDPLELVFSTGLAESVYAEVFDGICDLRLQRFLDLLSHENPNLRVLEVGAGTGRVTGHIITFLLEQESRYGSTRFSEYLYTDISPAFFERAAERFNDDRLIFSVFDLEKDPLQQGLEFGKYDLVIAGSVLHATANLKSTLENIHKLMKPKAKLLFLEMVAPEKIITNFGFGVFPGWWLCEEDYRALSPTISEKRWDLLLRETGFTGTDVVFRDYRSDIPHLVSMMVTTAVGNYFPCDRPLNPNLLLLVVDKDSDEQASLAASISRYASQDGYWTAEVISLFELAGYEGLKMSDVVIALLEFEVPFLRTMSSATFEALKRSFVKVKNLLWVTATRVNSVQYADYSLAAGFIRSMRLQAVENHIVSLAIEYQSDTFDAAQYSWDIMCVLAKSFQSVSTEIEFIIRDGHILIGRLAENKVLSDAAEALVSPRPKMGPWLPGPALKLAMEIPGNLDSFCFLEDDIYYETELGPEEVEFEAKAWGLSFRDLFVALGRLEETEMGFDCAGVITRVGAACPTDFRPGDVVYAGVSDCMRMFPRAHVSVVSRVPPGVDFETCTSILSPGATAYYALIDVAHLQEGEKVLIHSASGSTGQMAIWIAKMLKAEIFATVGFKEKKEFLIDKFGIPEDHIFYSRNTTFAQGIMRITKGYGIDVVLNSLAGDGLQASWECMAPYGRFVEIGKADIMAGSSLPMSGFRKNTSFAAVDLFHLATSRPALVAELIAKVMNLVERGIVHYPSPLHIYPVAQLEKAFRFFQSGRNMGRIVITVGRDDMVRKCYLERSTWTFDPTASYIVAGGLGGLGRAVLKWMIAKGARYLIVPSRSGPASTAAKEFLSQHKDVNVYTPECDVGDAAALSAMLKACVNTMPRIRGCINASMVLQVRYSYAVHNWFADDDQDAIFQNMSLSQWELTINSKVQTSWNLHQQLPESLDFFILFSSLSGVYGTVAQANYSAGCTFQDGLARYRTVHGQRAISIDIGWMKNIGIIAEREDYQRRREAEANMAQIEDTELLALLDLLCDPQRSFVNSADDSQVLLGAITPAMMTARRQEIPISVKRPLLSGFSQIRGHNQEDINSTGTNAGRAPSSTSLFRNATTSDERKEVVVHALKAKLARALFTTPEEIEETRTLPDYGVDSLLAVELRNFILNDFQASVTVFDIMGGETILGVGQLVVDKSGLIELPKGVTEL
ncbi:hypothetical protein F4859DRAFT_527822 [Xylaria cf. heliscus]|nr:hypothetical protein F4859DRAFT_527822 [Xylaria cf. heliscus]